MDLKKDEIVVKIENGKVLVSREILEEFEVEEYLRRLMQMDQQKEQVTAQLEQTTEMSEKFGVVKEEAEALRKAEEEKAKAEREAAANEPANN